MNVDADKLVDRLGKKTLLNGLGGSGRGIGHKVRMGRRHQRVKQVYACDMCFGCCGLFHVSWLACIGSLVTQSHDDWCSWQGKSTNHTAYWWCDSGQESPTRKWTGWEIADREEGRWCKHADLYHHWIRSKQRSHKFAFIKWFSISFCDDYYFCQVVVALHYCEMSCMVVFVGLSWLL